MSKSQQDLIREEQRILDKLINELDQVMLKIDKKYTYSSLQAKKAKEQCLPDTYGALIAANHDQYAAFREKKRTWLKRKKRGVVIWTHTVSALRLERQAIRTAQTSGTTTGNFSHRILIRHEQNRM